MYWGACHGLCADAAWDAQLRPVVAQLMADVRALPPLSLAEVGAAARLALPQIGCSNPRWAGMAAWVHLNRTRAMHLCWSSCL